MGTSDARTRLQRMRVAAGTLYAIGAPLRYADLYGLPGFTMPGFGHPTDDDIILLSGSMMLFYLSSWGLIIWKRLYRPLPTLALQVSALALLSLDDMLVASTWSSSLTWTLQNALQPMFWVAYAVEGCVLLLCLLQFVYRVIKKI